MNHKAALDELIWDSHWGQWLMGAKVRRQQWVPGTKSEMGSTMRGKKKTGAREISPRQGGPSEDPPDVLRAAFASAVFLRTGWMWTRPAVWRMRALVAG
jgi:hypothetical protein